LHAIADDGGVVVQRVTVLEQLPARVTILMTQSSPANPDSLRQFKMLVQQAVVD